MKKNLVLIAAVILLIASGIFLVRQNRNVTAPERTNPVPSTPASTQAPIIVSLQIGDQPAKSAPIDSGKTALELLQQETTVVVDGEGEDAFVTTINGREANEEEREFWAFYVNGKQAPVGAGSYQLKAGDQIQWKIEVF